MQTNKRRESFQRALRERDGTLADLYEAGLRLIEGEYFPGRAPLVAHVVRELRRGLPSVFARTPAPPHLDHHGRLEQIYSDWEGVRSTIPPDTQLMAADATVSIPLHLAKSLDDLIRDDANVAPTLRRRFLEMCATATSESISWSGNESLASRWVKIRAESLAHLGSRKDADERAVGLFNQLEEIALKIFEYAPQREERIKELARQATPENVADALGELVTLHDSFTFFQELKNPALLEVLRTAKALSIPEDNPPIYWPPADYLSNVAAAEPAQVAAILIEIKTRMPGTIRSLFSVALKLSDSQMIKVARKATWIHNPIGIAFLEQFIDLIERLVNADESDLAFDLSKALLRLKQEPGLSDVPGFDHPRAASVIERDWYGRILERLLPILMKADNRKTLALLADMLERAIHLEEYDKHDLAGAWYQNMVTGSPHHDVKSELTDALLKAAIESSRDHLDEVLRFLDERSSRTRLYRRMWLAVVVRNGSLADAQVVLRNEELWRENGAEHLALVERFYKNLPAEEREAVAQIAISANEDSMRQYFQALGRTAEEIESWVPANIASRFGTALDGVPEPTLSRLKGAQAAAAPPAERRIPDFDALSAMSPADVIGELRSWPAQLDTPWDPAWQIGSAVRLLLERNGSQWLADINSLIQMPDYFWGWALFGLQSYRRSGAECDDQAVFVTVEAALKRAHAIVSADADGPAIARHIAQPAGLLLADIAKDVASADDLSRILALAKALADLPAMESSTESPPSPWSAPDAALGQAQGLAVVIAGELLLKAHRNDLDSSGVAALYDALASSRSVAVRGALGQFFSWFATVHSAKAQDWPDRIFLSDDENLNRAAWSGYVLFSEVNHTSYKLLRNAYVRRMADLASAQDENSDLTTGHDSVTGRRVQESTMWHIWVLFANRVETLEDPNSLPSQLFNADSILIAALMRKVAHSLRAGESEQSQMVNEQAVALWEKVRSLISEGRMSAQVLSALPAWAKAAALSVEWRFGQIEDITVAADEVHFSDAWDLVQALVDLAATDRLRSVRILERLARTAHTGFLIPIQMYAGPLLRMAVNGDDDEAHLARAINSVLVTNHRPDLLAASNDDASLESK